MRIAAFILQLFCLIFSGGGLTIYFIDGADCGFILITLGSLIFAVSTKLYKLALLKENKSLKKGQQNECTD